MLDWRVQVGRTSKKARSPICQHSTRIAVISRRRTTYVRTFGPKVLLPTSCLIIPPILYHLCTYYPYSTPLTCLQAAPSASNESPCNRATLSAKRAANWAIGSNSPTSCNALHPDPAPDSARPTCDPHLAIWAGGCLFILTVMRCA